MNTAVVRRRRGRSLALSGVLLAALVAALMIVGVRPALADSYPCQGTSDSTCVNAGYTDHGYAANSGTSWWSEDTGVECTNYVAFVEKTVNGAPTPSPDNLGNGSQWATNAGNDGFTVNNIPVVGSVARWNANADDDYVGPDGHVAYVESVGTDGSITISQDNAPSGDFSWMVIGAGSPDWPSNFIHFQDMSNDFSGSGRADLAWDQSGTLDLFTGQSNGTFDFGGSTSGIDPATWEVAGNFAGGSQDEVASYNSSSPGTLTTFQWSTSADAWQEMGQTTGLGNPSFVVVGDFLGNGKDDLAWDQSGTLYLLTGESNGKFTTDGSGTSGIDAATWEGAGYFAGDGMAQLVSYNDSGTGTLSDFQWSSSTDTFGFDANTTGIGNPSFVETGNFLGHRNGQDQLAWDQSGTLYLLTEQSNGTFTADGSGTSGIDAANWEGAGYFRGNGMAQLVSYSSSSPGTLSEFQWSSSTDTFGYVTDTTGIGSPSSSFAVVGGSP